MQAVAQHAALVPAPREQVPVHVQAQGVVGAAEHGSDPQRRQLIGGKDRGNRSEIQSESVKEKETSSFCRMRRGTK